MSFSFHSSSLIQFARDADISIKLAGRDIISNLKKGRTDCLNEFLGNPESKIVTDRFTEKTLLVPAPRSSPIKEGYVWPALSICSKLLHSGFGGGIAVYLERTVALQATREKGGADNRTSVQSHVDTLVINSSLPDLMEMENYSKIMIVDDVITQGRMASACYIKLKEQFPDAEIEIFTPVRTMSFDPVSELYLPNISTVNMYNSGKTFVQH